MYCDHFAIHTNIKKKTQRVDDTAQAGYTQIHRASKNKALAPKASAFPEFQNFLRCQQQESEVWETTYSPPWKVPILAPLNPENQ